MFVVFRVPLPGACHVFRKGEPFAQVIFVPQRASYRPAAMDADEQAQAAQDGGDDQRDQVSHIAEHEWKDPSGATFNNHYKVLVRAFADGGIDAVERTIREAAETSRSALPQTVAECMAAGNALLEKQQFDEARGHFARVLEREPDNAAALCQMGICIGCTGGPLNGIKLMARAAALEPAVASHHASLGQMLMLAGRHKDAETAMRTSLRLQPAQPELLSLLALALAHQGRLSDAIETCRRSLAVAPTALAYARMASILAHLRRHPEAKAAYEAALKLQPDFAEARRALEELLKSQDGLSQHIR